MALHRALGNTQGFSGFGLGQTGKVATFHDLGQGRIEVGQSFQGLLDGKDLRRVTLHRLVHPIEIRLVGATTSLVGQPSSRMVDQDLAHGACGDGEEMTAIAPRYAVLVGEFEISFVDQAGGVQGLGETLAELTPGDAAQIVVDRRHQAVESSFLATLVDEQQLRQVGGGIGHDRNTSRF